MTDKTMLGNPRFIKSDIYASHRCSISGMGAVSVTSGDDSRSEVYSSSEGSSKHAIAIGVGTGSYARAPKDGAIVLCCRDYDGRILAIRSSLVGENGIKPDVWYSLGPCGQFFEVPRGWGFYATSTDEDDKVSKEFLEKLRNNQASAAIGHRRKIKTTRPILSIILDWAPTVIAAIAAAVILYNL